ncbi:MAG: hypothetical protein IKF90_01455, partial [Parasporobacterium sp.]|nr:hypothetical protein [Parasporobacterium sp.]
EGHPDCAVACCNHYVVRNGRSTLAINENREKWVLSRKQAFEEALFHGCIDVSAWAKLYHVSIFKELRYPEGRIFEDTWLFGDIVNRTKEIVCGRKGCYYYEVRSNSLVNSAFKQKNMEFIESAKKLGADAVAYAPELQVGSIRRVNHARMSVLRYMEHCDKEYRELQKQLRADILSCASEYLSHPRTPARDKAAVACLRLGLKPFYAGWRLYTKLRER